MKNTRRNLIYIYLLIDPRTNEVRYVGQSVDPNIRLKQHLNDNINPHKQAWLDDLKDNSLLPELVVLNCVEKAKADATEKKIIRDGIDSGWKLTNIMNGDRPVSLDGETNWSRLIKRFISHDNYLKFKKLGKQDQYHICNQTAIVLIDSVIENGRYNYDLNYNNAANCAAELMEKY